MDFPSLLCLNYKNRNNKSKIKSYENNCKTSTGTYSN